MKKLNLVRAISLPVASAMMLAACAPQVAPTASTATAPKADTKAAQVAPLAPAVAAQPATQVGTVKGLVMAYNEATKKFEAVSGATVKVANQTATTDATGHYVVSGVAAGQHQVVVTKDGLRAGQATIQANAVWGLSNVDLAMVKPALSLKQEAPGEAPRDRHLVVGVVRDMRGCAVLNSVIDATVSSGDFGDTSGDTYRTISGDNREAGRFTTHTGFYGFEVRRVKDTAAQVTMNAYGATGGDIKLERQGKPVVVTLTADDGGEYLGDQGGLPVYSEGNNWDGAYVNMADIQLNQMKATSAPELLTKSGLILGREYTLKVAAGCSSRADEFFIRLTSGGKEYDVVPTTVEKYLDGDRRRDYALSMAPDEWDGSRYVTFRLPGILAGTTVTAQVMQLGLVPSAVTPAASVVSFTPAQWETALAVVSPKATQPETLTRTGINKSVNLAGDSITYTVTIRNDSDATLEFGYEGKLGHGMGLTPSLEKVTFNGVETWDYETEGSSFSGYTGYFVDGLTIEPKASRVLTLTFSTDGDASEYNFYDNMAFLSGFNHGHDGENGHYHNFNNDNKTPIGWDLDDVEGIHFEGAADAAITLKEFETDGWTLTKSISAVASNSRTVTLVLTPPPGYTGPMGALRIADETDGTAVATAVPTITGGTVKAGANTSFYKMRAVTEDTTVEDNTVLSGSLVGALDGEGHTEMAFEIYPSTTNYPAGITAASPLTITYKINGTGTAGLTNAIIDTDVRAISFPSGAGGTTFDSFWSLDGALSFPEIVD